MDIFVTARVETNIVYVAFAMNGRTYGKSVLLRRETTHLEIMQWAIEQALGCITKDTVHKKENMIVYQDVIKDRHILCQLLTRIRKRNQKTYIERCEDYLPFPGENLYQRVFSKNDTSYHFKEGDFVIARRGKRDDETEEQARANNDSFNLYARILSVDRDADRLYMDKYMSRGFVSCGSKYAMPLLEFELHTWYAPMTVEEMKAFREGLTKLMTDPWKYSKVESRETVRETYDKVLEAIQKMEAET